ncbi:hypothetical protein L1049_021438 [Liquidambar formosana]|uniref:Uncharacterized protein n=1 Tax=Liquidambar formosana TaxID=63359 RepID=A0AAP0N7B4_LIQFO
MSHQEAKMQNPEFQDSQGLDAVDRLASTTTTAFSDHCTMCGGSMKRRSPSSSSLHDPSTTDSEPNPKRIMVEEDHLVRGFSKISLPIIGTSVTSTIPSDSPVLRRCSSDPYNSPGITNHVIGAPPNQIPDSVLGPGCFLNPQSPDNTTAAKINVNATTTPSPLRGTSSALPPLPPTLRRTVSDPTSSAYQTPQGITRSFSRSPGSGDVGVGVQVPPDSINEESPNFKRLRRMKDRMKEMSQWWDEVMREGEDGGSDENTTNTAKDASDGTETEEEVSVEKVEEGLSIHFKCPCGKGYQIFISGGNCYYKLM